jgi:lipopolysaccharide assembly protein B
LSDLSFFFQSSPGLYAILALALGLGIAVGYRLNRRQMLRRGYAEDAAVHPSFFKGLNYLIHDNQDKAIEEFTRAVQVDSDTVETYVTLGNLFRSKGEIERAVRIRQSIILRPGVAETIKRQALYDLGLDYRKGGFIDRAIASFEQLLTMDPTNTQVYLQLEQLYEEIHDWGRSYQMRQKYSHITGSDDRNILAHHQTELGKVYAQKNLSSEAESCFKKAISLDARCVDGYVHLADLYMARGDLDKALKMLKKITQMVPEMSHLAFKRLDELKLPEKEDQKVEKFLQDCIQNQEAADVRLALAWNRLKKGQRTEAIAELKKALELNPRLVSARKALGSIILDLNMNDEIFEQYRQLLEMLDTPQRDYQCSQCGYASSELMWKCPQCHRWDTIHRIETAL